MSFKCKWNAAPLIRKVRAAAYEGIKEVGLDLKAHSQRICPKDKGFDDGLVSTADLTTSEADMRLALSYYDMNYRHKAGEMAHYLSDPLHTRGRLYMAHIGGKVRRAMSR
jgi:hypothetical protein